MSQVRFDFRGKVALVTGAAGGIGGALVDLLAQAGADVVLADLDADAVESRAAELRDAGWRAMGVGVNAADTESIDAMVALVEERLGRVDLLVPSAGIYPQAMLADMPDAAWRTVLSINLDGVYFLTKRLLPLMPSGSAIVNLSSLAGHRGSLGHGHYSVSKAGVIALTRNLALELGPRGIRVNSVSPGIIATQMTEGIRAEQGDRLIAQTPLGRDGTPDETASVIAFLLSDAASYVHGEIVHVNGGIFMAG